MNKFNSGFNFVMEHLRPKRRSIRKSELSRYTCRMFEISLNLPATALENFVKINGVLIFTVG
jgi:hypothetical protein